MSETFRQRKMTISESIVCWLDTKTNATNENIRKTIEELGHCVQSVYKFEELDACIDLISDIQENETVYLIISECFDEQYLTLLDLMTQIKAIYLVHNNTSISDEKWTKRCHKMKRVTNKIETICMQIRRDIRKYSNDLIAFQTYTRPKNFDKFSSNDLNSSFMYSQLIKEMLVDIDVGYDEDYVDMFIEVCRTENEENNSQLVNITSFQREYKKHSAIWWYTKESFLYTAVNRALRTQDVTTLFMMGFFIRDLHLHSDYDVSLMFARSAGDHPEQMGILFRMNLDCTSNSFKETQSPFASLEGVSFYPDENEILFSMHTIFRIVDVHQIETRLWLIELDLTNDKDEQLSEVLAQLRSEIHVSEVFNVDKLGKLCLKMGDYDGALEVYETLLRLFPDNQVLLTYVHHHLGLVYQSKNDLDQAIIHYEKAIDIRRSLVSENEAEKYLVTTYANLSTLYVNKGDLAQAQKYCERALAINMQLHDGEEYDPIIHSYHLGNLAFIQRFQGNLVDSLTNYQKVIELRLKCLSSYHPDLAVAYSNLGTVQGSLENYMDAVQSMKRALEISKKSLPDNHETFARIHYNIAIIFDNWQRHDEALKHIQCAIDIAQQLKSFDKTELQDWTDLADKFRENLNTKE